MEFKINKNYVFTLIVLMWMVSICNFIIFKNYAVEQIVLLSSAVFSTLAVIPILYRKSEVIALSHFIVLLFPFISALANGSGLGSMICMVNLFNILFLAREFTLTQKQHKILSLIVYFSTLFIMLLYIKKSGIMYVNIISGTDLNPNGYATIGLINAIIAVNVIINLKVKNKTKYILNILYAFISIFILINTGARTSMVALLCYYILSLIFYKKKSFKKPELLVIIFMICCFLFAFVYVFIHDYVSPDLEILGKKLFTGRQKIWLDIFNRLKTDWLFGFSNQVAFNDKWVNTHNAYLAIWGNLGILTFISFMIYLFYSQKGKIKNCRYNKHMYFAVFVMLFISTFEVFLLDGNYYFLVIPIFINKVEAKESDKQDNPLLLVWEDRKTCNRTRMYRNLA